MPSTTARLADAGRSLATAVLSGGRGAWRTAKRGAHGAALGAHGLVRRRRGAGALLGVGVARLLLQLPADAVVLLLVRLVSAVQTVLGLETACRRLDGAESALLRRVFAGGLDPRPVRLKVGRLGLLGLPRRAFVVGDTVYVPHRGDGSLAGCAAALLVHEPVHVWQHQRHGTRYLSECLLAQWLGDGYNVAVAVEAGRAWTELNFEQQAELLEQAFAAGCLGDGAEPGLRLLLRLTDRRRDDGFEIEMASAPLPGERLAAGWRDATSLLVEGLAAVREPRAAGRRKEC